MTYEQAIASGAFTPSAHALQVDAFIDAHPPQTHPEFWQFGGGATGWIYVGPNAGEGSRSEWADWKNGQQSFGSDGTADGFTSAAYVGSFAQMNDVLNGIYRDKNGNIIPEEVVNAGYWYDHVNETMHVPGSLADTLPYHPETFEPGSWKWDPQVGWFNNDNWVTTVGGPYFSGNNPNAPQDPPPPPPPEPQVIGWYWDGSAWQPIYQGQTPPAGLPEGWVVSTSAQPNSPPQTNNGGDNNADPGNNGGSDGNNDPGSDPGNNDSDPGNNDGDPGNNGSDPSADPVIIGWYYALLGGVAQWIPVYEGYSPLAGAPYVEGPDMPTSPPEGYGPADPNNGGTDDGSTDPNNGSTDPNTGTTDPNTGTTDPNTGTTDPNAGTTDPNAGTTDPNAGTTDPNTGTTDPNTGTTNPTTPTPPTLYTPTDNMFFNGLFTAVDVLGRDGGAINSSFYRDARQKILDDLAAQAAGAGRSQNTAEEIELAQAGAQTGFGFNGMFDPKYSILVKDLGF